MSAIQRGYLTDSVFNGLFRLIAAVNFQTRWEFGHAMLAFGVQSPAAVLREFDRYTLQLADGKSALHHVHCPVMVTGSRETLYFPVETSALRIYDGLEHLEGDKRELWVPTGVGQGALQAKVAALSHLHLKTFGWLDWVFGIERSESIGS